MTVAISTNVAVLGLFAVAAASLLWLLCALSFRRTLRKDRGAANWIAMGVVTVTTVLVILISGVLTIGTSLAETVPFCALSALAVGVGCSTQARREGLLPPVIRLGLLGALTVSILSTAAFAVRAGDRVEQWVAAQGEAPAGGAERPSIVLIVLDTLRADRVGVYGGGELTPNLDRLAESSIVYTNAISTAPWTLPTHASLFTGLYPDETGVSWGHYKLEDRFETLAELLSEQGYETFAVSNNLLLSEKNGYAQGFDTFVETTADPFIHSWRYALQCAAVRRVATWFGIPADAGDDAGSAWTNWLVEDRLTRATRPLFLFLNYYEAHDPYLPLQRYRESHLTAEQREAFRRFRQDRTDLIAHACGDATTYSPEQVELMEALYDAEVAYQDEVVGNLLTILERNGALDNSWIVITSDHGELFGEWDMVFHTAGWHYNLLHVPLLVRPPGGTSPRKIEALVQPVDVFSTLAAAGGAEVPSSVRRAHRLPNDPAAPGPRQTTVSQTFGASLVALSMAQQRSAERDFTQWLKWVTCVTSGGYFLEIFAGEPNALYDVRVDPGLTNNLIEERPDVAASLLTQVQDVRQRNFKGEQP